jgi:hypothetical protein|tara:strand:- start:19 stop:681 length:663 start_codon:yes stop_codon:yes gene_type:complete
MATMTYSSLTQDLKDWMENDGTEFSNETDNFIGLAEQRIVRDIDPQAFTTSAYSSFNVNDRFVTKPTDALIIRHLLYLDSDSKRNFLEKKTDEFIYDYWPTSATTGTPKYWTDYNDTELLVAPTPSAALTIEMSYVQRLDTLSSSNTTNWLTINAQELLLFGSLMEACTFSKNREDLQIYSQRYKAAVDSINNQTRRRRRDDYNAPANVMGESNIQQATT